MIENFYAVIMAGGGGTRLWPLSTKDRPKQLLEFLEGQSLFSLAIERLKGLIRPENIFIVTIADQVSALRVQSPQLSLEQFIIEPQPKGTASVVGLAAVTLMKKNPDAVLAILTADHIIENNDLFHQLLNSAYELASRQNLITLGIAPTYPATGYGYIKAGRETEFTGAFNVEKFVEKPDEKTAAQYLREGNYFWNSGMFIWRADRILNEFERQMPDLFQKLEQIASQSGQPGFEKFFTDIWATISPQTIDYGIMENAENILVLKAADLGWNDIGCWDSLYEFLQMDSCGNVMKTNNALLLDSEGILLLGENEKKIIVALGIKDLVIIDTEKALLVCKRGESQRVKQVIEALKKKNLDSFL